MEQIRLNLIPTGPMPTCHASQYDKKREIGLVLFNGTRPLLLTDETLELDVRKSDSHIVTIDVPTPEGKNLAVFETTEQMCAVAGSNECELRIKKAGADIGTLNFIMEIERSPMENGLQSDSEIRNLERQIAEAATPVVEEIAPPIIRDFLDDDYYTAEETDEAIETAIEGKADKTYVDTELAKKADKNNTYTKNEVDTLIDNLPEPMIFKGTLGVGGTVQTLPTASASNEGYTYKVITEGTYAEQTAKVGDVFTSNGSEWVLIPAGDEDNDTWRNIKVNGTEVIGSGISSGAVDFIGSENIEIEYESTGNKIKAKTKNLYTKDEVDDLIEEAVYDLLPSDTESGPIASFETDLALPLKSLKIDVNAKQDLHGEANPYPSGGGINKFDKDTMLIDDAYINDTDGTQRTNAGDKCTDYIEILPNTAYYIVSEQTSGKWGAWYDENKAYISGINNYGSKTSPANAKYMRLTVVRQGNGNPDTFSINYPSTDTAYHPYSNICPITGHTEAKIIRAGKNLLDKEAYEWLSNANIIFGGTNTTISDSLILGAGTYTLSCSHNVTGFYVDNHDGIVKRAYNTTSTTFSISSRQAVRINLYIAGVTRSDLLSYNYQLELGSNATEYEPYVGNEYIINLGGTYYGGKLDVTTGKFLITYEKANTPSRNATDYGGLSSRGVRFPSALNGSYRFAKAVCNMARIVYSTNYFLGCMAVGIDNAQIYWFGIIDLLGLADLDAFKTWLDNNPVEVYYELATPIEIQLTPTQVATLIGTNNIYADSGDTAVEFKESINQKIASLQALLLST